MATTVIDGSSGGTAILRRLTRAVVWGNGLDGYDLGIISVVIAIIAQDLDIGSSMIGLIGASSLIGIFFGGPIFGYLTDRFGRRRLFVIDISILLVTGIAQAFVTDGLSLFVIRLLLGMAIGAEYAIGAPMLAEFCPAEGRGKRLSLLEVSWYVGFLTSVVVGYTMLALGIDWRFILATSAVPAILTLFLRYGMPESPRWLMSRGRTEEARRIIDTYLGGASYFDTEGFGGEQQVRRGLSTLFAKGYRSKTAFVSVFWACLVAPFFAIFTFAPVVFDSVGLTDERSPVIATNLVAVLGVTFGMVIIERVGRRMMLIPPFWVQAAALFIIGAWAHPPAWVIVGAFATYAFFNAISATLTAVYPSEVFDTDVRTSGVGLCAAASRVGAAIGTWLLPVGLDHLGIGPMMLMAAGVCAFGALLSQRYAPETTGRTLSEATAV